MSGRARRVLIYTVTLLLAPVPVMPYAKGTREFALALAVCGLALTLSSLYVVRGESKLKHRGLVGNKLLASSIITLAFGMGIMVGAVVYLIRAFSRG